MCGPPPFFAKKPVWPTPKDHFKNCGPPPDPASPPPLMNKERSLGTYYLLPLIIADFAVVKPVISL